MNGRPSRSARATLWTPALLSLFIFLADAATPRGLVISVLYAPLVYFGLRFTRPRFVFPYAYAFTFLTLIGWLFKAHNGIFIWMVVINRSISLIVLWLATALVYRYRQTSEALHKSEMASMQQEIDAQTALLATIVESSDDAILSKSLDGTIMSWNPGAQRLFGYSAQEAIGRPVAMLIPEELQQEETFMLSELKHGHATDHFETTRLHRTGKRIDVSITVSPIRDASGRIIGASTFVHDISAKKRADAEMAEYTRALVRSNQALDEFAYAASHDLKAPLRVIDNASKWLEEDLEPSLTPETRENLQLLRGRVRRMEKLLDDLLAYSRIGRKLDSEFAEQVAGDLLIRDVLAMVLPASGFIAEVDPGFAEIKVYRMPLQQIFMNLVGNAVKHHYRKEGHIHLSVEPAASTREPMLAFAVKDDGPGIPPQFHDRIFQMFQTLKPRDQVEGSGMGLAMVRKYVEVFGGTVWLESAEGQGSTFHFTWPLNQPRIGQQIGSPVGQAVTPGPAKNTAASDHPKDPSQGRHP
jgi:PAS domain S-box-containing protein